jgi:hypothetical protein
MKIWSNFGLSKVPNYDLAKVNKEKAIDTNLSFHITTYTKLLEIIKMEINKNLGRSTMPPKNCG